MSHKELKGLSNNRHREAGFSLVETVIVIAVVLVVAAFAIPSISMAIYNVRQRSAANSLASLMAQGRILAAKNNATYPIVFAVSNGTPMAFLDLNGNGTWDASVTVNGVTLSEPKTEFSGATVPAAGPPSGTGGQPTPYVLTGDSSTGTPYDNTNVLAYSPRGLPCEYSTPPVCTTPAATYFVYYLNGAQPGGAQGWTAVVVSKAGRTKTVVWNGTSWN